jgi:hypothetical protein
LYEGYPIIYPIDHLRALQNPCRESNSDVFIFESSEVRENYVLVIIKNEDYIDDQLETTFSLDIYSFIEVNIKEITKREVIKNYKLMDMWCPSIKLGGNILSPNFINNPQYKITLSSTKHLQFKLETLIASSVMIFLIHNNKHVSQIPFEYIENNKSPGFYFNSFSYFECLLDIGEYVIVCVCSEDVNISKYCLDINIIKDNKTNNNNDIKIEKLVLADPLTFTYIETVYGDWNQINNKGYKKENIALLIKNPGFIFNLTITTKMKFILRCNLIKIEKKELANITVVLLRLEHDDNHKIIFDDKNSVTSIWGCFSE